MDETLRINGGGMESEKKFSKGRTALVLEYPFFGSLVLRLKPVKDETCSTMWVDGRRIGYNPLFVDRLSLDELKGVLCHEVLHCGLQHHIRRGDRHPRKWNAAADFAINLILADANMTLPEGGLLDRRYERKSAEEIYALLPEFSGTGGSGDGDSKGADPGGCGEVRDAKGDDGTSTASKEERRKSGQDWKIAMSQAAHQARMAGNFPGSLERVIESILEPVLDWREILRRFIDSSAKSDYSWSRPNRRYIGKGIYLPAMYSNALGHVVAAVDTSGSIGQQQLDEFAAEINAILSDYRADCTVIYCDSKVQHVDKFPAGDTVGMSMHGGGGTDFVPPFEYLRDHDVDPVCMLYFTDGECHNFPSSPYFPVLWIQKTMWGDGEGFDPPFGEVLKLA